jgi:peptide/nickel transport system substrate-binding protein
MKRARAFPAVLAIVLVLQACSSGATSTPAPSGNKTLDKVTLASPTDFPSLDPSYRTSVAVAHALINIYDTLVTFDNELKLAPGLATSWKNTDPTTWEFSLRTGVSFSNGEVLNAGSVKAWFTRLQEIRDKALGASAIQLIPSVTAVTAVNDTTVRFTTKEPDPTLPGRLATYFTSITPADPFKGGDTKALMAAPIGSGPYMVKENVAGDHLTLVSNPKYWGTAPIIKEIEYRIVKDAAGRAAALRSKQADLAFDLPIADLAGIGADTSLKVLAMPEATRVYWFLLGTSMDGPLANKQVRQAINYAVDRKAIITKLLAGHAQETSSLVSRQAFGYCDVPGYSYDVAKAKQLLTEAGYANGFTMDVSYSPGNTTAEEQVVQAVGNYLADVGIKLNYIQKDLLPRIADLSAKKVRGLFYLGQTSPFPDADYILGEFQPTGIAGWMQPLTGQSQSLYLQERKEMNPEARAKLACDIQKLQRDEAPVLYLWQMDLINGQNATKLNWDMSSDGIFRASRVTAK